MEFLFIKNNINYVDNKKKIIVQIKRLIQNYSPPKQREMASPLTRLSIVSPFPFLVNVQIPHVLHFIQPYVRL